MKLKRRAFVAALATASAAVGSTAPALAAERTSKVRPGLNKAELPTPALLVDLDAFEFNLKVVADHCQQAGCKFRPHAKTHKCPEIARRQIAAGAIGICTATVPEAEALVAAKIPGVLLTSPIVEPGKIARMVELARKGRGVMLSVGHPLQVERLAETAASKGVVVDVLIDLDVGDRRTGALPGEPALELARAIGKKRALRLRGLQAYSGTASHVSGYFARLEVSRKALAKAVETRELLAKSGFEAPILSGGSTGTYNIDSGTVTELQVGSYVFMDVNYMAIGGKNGSAVYKDFRPSLTVLTTVVSAAHPDHVTVDAGIKAFSTDTGDKPAPKAAAGISYRKFGDEFGALTTSPGTPLPAIGDRLEFFVPHCDPTVNLYDRIYATRGDKVEAIWPVMARRETQG